MYKKTDNFFKQSERWQFIYYYLCKIIITTNNK